MHQSVPAVQVRRRHVLILPLIEQYREKLEHHLTRYEVAANGCHNWTGRIITNKRWPDHKYGAITVNKNTRLFVHRLSYAYHNNKEPGALLVRHSCDNGVCMNPGHLLLGTFDENMNDMRIRGRSTFGEKSTNSILTEEEVKIIIERLNYNSNLELAEAFGGKVRPSTIAGIRSGKSWSYLSRPKSNGRTIRASELGRARLRNYLNSLNAKTS